tara:strand:+ start:117 stop:329 length:213 start_codon:yes stop_codon:yes gene_type:complete
VTEGGYTKLVVVKVCGKFFDSEEFSVIVEEFYWNEKNSKEFSPNSFWNCSHKISNYKGIGNLSPTIPPTN